MKISIFLGIIFLKLFSFFGQKKENNLEFLREINGDTFLSYLDSKKSKEKNFLENISIKLSDFFFEKKKDIYFYPEHETYALKDILCYYVLSPKYHFDSRPTYKAINKLLKFMKRFPNSSSYQLVSSLVDNLNFKIEYKYYDISYSYFLMKKYEPAIFCFQKFLKKFPNSSLAEKVLYNICISEYKLKNKNDFYNFYEKYLKKYPNNSNVKYLKHLFQKMKNTI